MKQKLIRYLLRLLGYAPTHFDYPEIYAVADALDVGTVTTDRKKAIYHFERYTGKGAALVRYIPAERILVR